MKMTAKQIRVINKRIERTSKACEACPFYNNKCVEGLIPILISKKYLLQNSEKILNRIIILIAIELIKNYLSIRGRQIYEICTNAKPKSND